MGGPRNAPPTPPTPPPPPPSPRAPPPPTPRAPPPRALGPRPHVEVAADHTAVRAIGHLHGQRRRAQRVSPHVDEPGGHAVGDLVRPSALQAGQEPASDEARGPVGRRWARKLGGRGEVETSAALVPEAEIVGGENPGAIGHSIFITEKRPAPVEPSRSAGAGGAIGEELELGAVPVEVQLQPHGRHSERQLGRANRNQRREVVGQVVDRKSTRLNSSHLVISYAVFC